MTSSSSKPFNEENDKVSLYNHCTVIYTAKRTTIFYNCVLDIYIQMLNKSVKKIFNCTLLPYCTTQNKPIQTVDVLETFGLVWSWSILWVKISTI